MSDPSIKRLKEEIQKAYHPKGMSTHSGKMQVLASDVDRIIKKFELCEAELAQARKELGEAQANSLADVIDLNNEIRDWKKIALDNKSNWEAAEGRNTSLTEQLRIVAKHSELSDSKNLQLAAQVAVMVEIIKWYGDPIAYSMPVQDMKHHVFPDRGEKARQALANLPAEADKGNK